MTIDERLEALTMNLEQLIIQAETRAKAYADEQCRNLEAHLSQRIALLERLAALEKRVSELEAHR